MARTESTLALPVGTPAPRFDLIDTVSHVRCGLDTLTRRNGGVVMFICNHCPYVLHVLDALLAVVRDYAPRGIDFAAICSNDESQYPQDGPEPMRKLALQRGFSFPYLHDPDQSVARAYHAACTPDFFVVAPDGRLTYCGRLDDSTPGNGRPTTGADLRAALDALLEGRPPLDDPRPSVGCNIKWRP